MIVTNAPGVYSTIVDKSQYPAALGATTAAAQAFISPYGPDNEWMLITGGGKQLVSTFGTVDPKYGQAYLNAYRFATVSTNLYAMRVLPNADDGTDSNPIDPATFAHVIFTLIQDANNTANKSVLPVYFNKVQDKANTLVDDTRKDAPTKFTNLKKTLPDGTSTNTNVYDYIATNIVLTDDQKKAIENDPNLKATYLESKNITDLDNTLQPFMIIYAIGRGSYYNSIGIRITPLVSNPGVFIVEVYSVTDAGKFTLESFYVSFDPNAKDLSGESMFIEHVINKYSKYIRVLVNQNMIPTLLSPVNNKTLIESILDGTLYTVDTYNTSIPLTEIQLDYGREGDIIKDGLVNTDVYTKCLINAYNGLYDNRILNKEEIVIDLVIDANFPMAVKQAIVNLVQKRADCFAVLDLPPVSSVDDMLDTMLNQFSWLNTYLAAVYSPFGEIKHPFTGQTVKASAAYHATYIYPQNDQNGIWKAPAGLRRGVLTDLIRPIVTVDPNETVLSKLLTNRINPIVKKRGVYVYYGNTTSQRVSSALSDINVVRTLLKIDREISRFCDNYIYEDNTPDVWLDIEEGVRQILSKYAKEGALYWFQVDVGATEYEIKNHIVHVNVYLSVTRVIKVISLTYTVK